jgi:uncharacterized protein (DUF433 family)
MGKPCFTGTRILVYLIVQKLAARETADEILTAYPLLRAEHIRAALEYASQLAAEENCAYDLLKLLRDENIFCEGG